MTYFSKWWLYSCVGIFSNLSYSAVTALSFFFSLSHVKYVSQSLSERKSVPAATMERSNNLSKQEQLVYYMNKQTDSGVLKTQTQ